MPEDQTIESLEWAYERGKVEANANIISVDGHEVFASEQHRPTTLLSLEQFADKPYRVKEERQFVDVVSFTGYLSAMGYGTTALFGSLKQANVLAILDYREKADPSWHSDRATLVMARTPEWEAFRAVNGRPQAQADFALFLERWAYVVESPDPANLAEIARNLEGATTGKFSAKINHQNGSFKLGYEEDTVLSSVFVPEKMTIKVAPFFASPPLEIVVPIRIRVREGVVSFMLDIPNLERIEMDALISVFSDVTAAIDLPVYVGP